MGKALSGLLLAAWMLVIFLFSSQTYEQQTLKPWLGQVLSEERMRRYFSWVRIRYGGHPISIEALGTAAFTEFFIRKAAHLTEYAVLGSLLLLALRYVFRRKRALVPLTVVLCFLFAAGDEYHQSFVSGRTPMAADALLDTLGAVVGIAITLLVIALFGLVPGKRVPAKERVG
ncbi:VanZ family protein [Cohnella nanjingensis]|uniref:VanZ family protein n=1 Tax=Cohnella nanjingensis TaxID=1387779 RepID=A0A7X0RQH8_9BACL|nr:VanZ family protein [Cohnella nanjingensis]MBB6671691.1 VanZ family protein [Cohnella nanjingensis]